MPDQASDSFNPYWILNQLVPQNGVENIESMTKALYTTDNMNILVENIHHFIFSEMFMD